MNERCFLVTGAHGCIGAWVVHELAGRGESIVTFDVSSDPRRIALLLPPDQIEAIPHVVGDISDLETVERVLDEHAVTNVIHLAALQVPFCRADPPLGARVNVLGTVNVFEAVRRRLDRMGPIVYASSIAAFDTPEDDRPPSLSGYPGTIYGVYKRANEGTAWVYGVECGVPSVGLRPHTVYGVGRDQGLTSAPTTAMLAAAARVPYTIPYGGAAQLQLAQDVARAFVEAGLSESGDATVHSLPGPRVRVSELIETIAEVVPASAGTIGFEEVRLPFPEEADGATFGSLVPGFTLTPLADGVQSTVERFRALLAAGRIAAPSDETR
jgi:nucleoside-diphosphate-sugar epimerase